MCAALATLPDVGRVLRDGLHHVHRDRALACGEFERHADFAVQRSQVQPVERVLVFAVLRLREQVGMVVAQVHAGDGPDGAEFRDVAGQAVGGHAYAHAALHDGQQAAPAQLPARERLGERGGVCLD